MIVDINNSDLVGRNVPNVNIKSVELRSQYSFVGQEEKEIKKNIKVTYFLQDELDNKLSFNWIDEEDLVNNVYIRTALVYDKKLFEEILKNVEKLNDSEFIKINEQKISQNNILLKDVVRKYQDLRDIKPEILQNGEKKFYFYKNINFETVDKKDVYLICFSFIPDEFSKIKIVGKINAEIVLEAEKTVKTFIYADDIGNYSLTQEDPEVFVKTEYENFKVKDLRILDKKPKIKKVVLRKNRQQKSNLYLTRNSKNQATALLSVNMDEVLYDSSEIYKYFNDNQEIKDIIKGYSKIQSLKIYRNKIKKGSGITTAQEQDFSFPITKDSEKNLNLLSFENSLFSIREIKGVSSDRRKNVRYFTFKDKNSNTLKRGKYNYALEMNVVDGSKKFLYSDILEAIIKNKNVLNLYLKESLSFSLNRFGESFLAEAFYKIFEEKYADDVAEIIKSISAASIIFYPEYTKKELEVLFSTCLHPLSATVETIQKILEYNSLLEIFTNNLLTNIEKIDPYQTELKQTLIAPTVQFTSVFSNLIYDAETPENIGFEYINHNPVSTRRANDDKTIGIPIYNKQFIDDRVNKEIRKYFINESPSISFNGVANNDPFTKFLYNQTIDSVKLSYFSPAFADFLEDSYDFSSIRKGNDNFAYEDTELRAKNLKYRSRDKFFNAYYALENAGINFSEIDGQQRVVSGKPDTLNPSIFEDYSKKTGESSKTKLSRYNFTGLVSTLSSNENGINEFFDYFSVNSQNYILRKLTNSKQSLTEEQIREYVKRLPNQLKSLIFKNLKEVADQINLNLSKQKDNISFYPKAKIDFNMLKRVEFLEGYDKNTEIWKTLDQVEFNKLKGNSSNSYIICRLTNYNNEITGNKIFEEIDLPVFNEYFFIDLENVKQTEEQQDEMQFFKTYNIRTEEINTVDPVSNTFYSENLRKLLELP